MWGLLLNKYTPVIALTVLVGWKAYDYHIDAITDAELARDKVWQDTFDAEKARQNEKLQEILERYSSKSDADINDEFSSVFGSAPETYYCRTGCVPRDTRELSVVPSTDTYQEVLPEVQNTEGSELSYEGEVEYQDLSVDSCVNFPTVDERKACFQLLN